MNVRILFSAPAVATLRTALATAIAAALAVSAPLAAQAPAAPPVPPPLAQPGGPATPAAATTGAPGSDLTAPGDAIPVSGPSIALLLPVTGHQAGAGTTVRDGFLTAWYSAPAADRPPLRIYDTAALGVAAAIDNATRDGAVMLVGPLTREDVAAAADHAGSHPPILALNALPAGHPAVSGLWQFALSPEDEARQAARRVLADGHRSGVALVPSGDWGNRVLAAFRDELSADGGELLDTQTYGASGDDAEPIEHVLRIDESEARHRRLESVLGAKLQFQPSRRTDIDFIFAPGQAGAERTLRPQLRYWFAGDLATYATADAFLPDPAANMDLDGLIFPGSPWMLGGPLADSVREAAGAAWPAGGPHRNVLFAFGFDAWRLAAALRAQPAGTSVAVDGLSGRLTIGDDGHVHRALQWAQMRDGEPRALPDRELPQTTPRPAPAAGSAPAATSNPAAATITTTTPVAAAAPVPR